MHYCWNYLTDAYSLKKTRNLVDTQIEKYKKMVADIQQGSQKKDYLTDEEKENMSNDLLSFANSLSNETL